MSSSSSHSHTHAGSPESQVHVLDYCSQKHTLLEPQKQLKTPKCKNITLHTRSPILPDRVRHVRFLVRPPSISPETAKTSTPLHKVLASTYANTYRNDYGYHYAGAGSPTKPPTRQAPQSFEISPKPSFQQKFSRASPETRVDFINALSAVSQMLDSGHHQPTTVTHSTTTTTTTPSSAAGPAQPSTPSPVTRCAPDAPLRRQGCTKLRFEALSCAKFVPRSNTPSPLSQRALCYSPPRRSVTLSPITPRQPLTPIRPDAQDRKLSHHTGSPAPSSRSQRVSLHHHPASPASTRSPVLQFRLTHSPQPSESYSRADTATPPLVVQHMPLVLCPQGDEARFRDWVASLKARKATIGHWIDGCHSPGSCEPAVTSPSASSVADSWSARSTSIATTTSGSPFPYRIPIVRGECDFISALAGKRIWRFSAADKASYLDFLDMADPQRLLQTPPTRGASIRNWIADIPTPRTPSPAPPSRLRDLTPSPISSSFFSSCLGSPKDLDTQAHGLPAISPSQEFSPACQASPSSQASSDGWLFAPRRFFIGRASPAASPSIRASSPVARSSPAPAASLNTLCSPPAVIPSPSPASKLPDALCKLQALLEAGSPQPITRSSPSVIPSSLTATASPLQQASPVASPTTHIHSSLTATRSMTPPRPHCRKRKLAADASPAPVRPRPAVFTRFEPPTAFRFSPALPGSLPSLPPAGPMPGSFPTTICLEPLAPAALSTPAPDFPWKTVAGVAVGAFALGCLAARYLL